MTESLAPELQQAGMVTSALWSDVDNDGWLDLLVTFDYGSIKLFANQQGMFEDETRTAKLDKLLGWWNSIAGCDVDLDGDLDYVVANLGRNTKYHPSADHPTVVVLRRL